MSILGRQCEDLGEQWFEYGSSHHVDTRVNINIEILVLWSVLVDSRWFYNGSSRLRNFLSLSLLKIGFVAIDRILVSLCTTAPVEQFPRHLGQNKNKKKVTGNRYVIAIFYEPPMIDVPLVWESCTADHQFLGDLQSVQEGVPRICKRYFTAWSPRCR